MGTAATKKKLLGGMSASNAKKAICEVWAKSHATSFMKVHRDFQREHGITLLAVCEMWHSFRAKNRAVEAMIASFAHSVDSKNTLNKKLENTIHLQREELGKRLREIAVLKSRHLQTDGGQVTHPTEASSGDTL